VSSCARCASPLRSGIRFCTACGEPLGTATLLREPPGPEPVPLVVTPTRQASSPPARSRAARWAFATGLLPFLTSGLGNALVSQWGPTTESAGQSLVVGQWPLPVVLAVVVVIVNTGLILTCALTGSRALRETADPSTAGRSLALWGLGAGAVNLALLVVGLLQLVSTLAPVLAQGSVGSV
jgi:hypothetical protein